MMYTVMPLLVLHAAWFTVNKIKVPESASLSCGDIAESLCERWLMSEIKDNSGLLHLLFLTAFW